MNFLIGATKYMQTNIMPLTRERRNYAGASSYTAIKEKNGSSTTNVWRAFEQQWTYKIVDNTPNLPINSTNVVGTDITF